jgi:signal transduction histidine kinase
VSEPSGTGRRSRRREAAALVIVSALIILGLLTVFAIELSNTQARSKADVESRVHERSVLAAALIDGLFQSSASSGLVADIRRYGKAHVSDARLSAAQGQGPYVVLVNPQGGVIAHSSGFNAQAQADLGRSAALRLLQAGHPWALGNVLPFGHTGVINYGVALHTAVGTRYLLTGITPQLLGGFLTGELRQIPGVKDAHNFVLDGNGEVIVSTNPKRPTGYMFHTPTEMTVLHHRNGDVANHYFDQVPLHNTTWRILLTAPNGPLFASVSGLRKSLPWLIFAAFALVALLALILALRALRANAEVRYANAQLAVANDQLAQTNDLLAGTNDELERRARELARSNAELDQFASIASHDLQEPLRKIRTFSERVVHTESAALSDKGRDYLNRTNASAERMQRLIEDLLKFSRVSTQGHAFTQVDLGQVTADVLEDLGEAIQQSGSVVRVGQLPTISADAPQMRQLVQNLISNALKFRRAGVTPEIFISATVEGEQVNLVVQDNGIGFEPQYARRIFRIFERLHGRGAYPGTGIGLALCRKIAERHGGTVRAHSIPGEGATFTVIMQSQRKEAVIDLVNSDAPDESAPDQEPYVPA